MRKNYIMNPEGKILGYQKYKHLYIISLIFGTINSYSLHPKAVKNILIYNLPKGKVKIDSCGENNKNTKCMTFFRMKNQEIFSRGHEDKWVGI